MAKPMIKRVSYKAGILTIQIPDFDSTTTSMLVAGIPHARPRCYNVINGVCNIPAVFKVSTMISITLIRDNDMAGLLTLTTMVDV